MNDGLFPGVGSGFAGTRGRFAVQVIESSTTVPMVPWARFVSILGVAGGGGGGGGRLGFTTNAGGGAGGGGGGSQYYKRLPLQLLADLRNLPFFTVTIGAGGTGGAGATVDANNGSNGTSGGSTKVSYIQKTTSTSSSDSGISQTGGSGGGGGSTGTATGGSGGFTIVGHYGQQGGNGFVGTTEQSEQNYSANQPYMMLFPTCGGGFGSGGKGTTFNRAERLPNFQLGNANTGLTFASTLGENGEDAVVYASKIVDFALSQMTTAPSFGEFYFASTMGGHAGTGGSSSGAVVSGGNGGAGWRGSGGGGGGGAGQSGAVGGTGGKGGAGVVYFFWEEY